jgi:hypothetical protein
MTAGPLTDCPKSDDWSTRSTGKPVYCWHFHLSYFASVSPLRAFLCAAFCCRTEVFARPFSVLIRCWSHLLKWTCFSHLPYSRAIKLTGHSITSTIPLESFVIRRQKTRSSPLDLRAYQWAFIGAKVLSCLLLSSCLHRASMIIKQVFSLSPPSLHNIYCWLMFS